MISTSGSQLLPESAVIELRKRLLPLTTVLTPNIPEAKLLLKDAGADVPDPEDLSSLVQLAKQVSSLGPKAILLKGGHLALTKDHKIAHDPRESEMCDLTRQRLVRGSIQFISQCSRGPEKPAGE